MQLELAINEGKQWLALKMDLVGLWSGREAYGHIPYIDHVSSPLLGTNSSVAVLCAIKQLPCFTSERWLLCSCQGGRDFNPCALFPAHLAPL